jgi:hypothetical protein
MTYFGGLGGLDADERAMYQELLVSFANRLSGERQKTADLRRQLEAATQRLAVLEAVSYGAIP